MENKKKKMKKVIGIVACCLILFLIISSNIEYNLSERSYLEANSDLGTVDGWEFNTSRDASQYILSDNSTILKPKHFCEKSVFLLIIVCSAPANIFNRNAIRETWGSQNKVMNKSVQVFFLMGESYNVSLQQDIIEESIQYNDVIQDHFVDSYNNLTLKSIVMLKLVSIYCPESTTFLMKTDDDMFVFMPSLINALQKSSTSNLLIGNLICGAKPIKDTTNKWYTPSYMYHGKVYPNYLSGTGYVMSIDVVARLYEAALQTPILHLEDVYITGILAKEIKLRPRNNGGFTFEKRKYDPCIFKSAITSHRFSPSELREQYSFLQTTNLSEECTVQKQSKNTTFNLFGYFTITKVTPKKRKKNMCF